VVGGESALIGRDDDLARVRLVVEGTRGAGPRHREVDPGARRATSTTTTNAQGNYSLDRLAAPTAGSAARGTVEFLSGTTVLGSSSLITLGPDPSVTRLDERVGDLPHEVVVEGVTTGAGTTTKLRVAVGKDAGASPSGFFPGVGTPSFPFGSYAVALGTWSELAAPAYKPAAKPLRGPLLLWVYAGATATSVDVPPNAATDALTEIPVLALTSS
jgi:hypothetical protein